MTDTTAPMTPERLAEIADLVDKDPCCDLERELLAEVARLRADEDNNGNVPNPAAPLLHLDDDDGCGGYHHDCATLRMCQCDRLGRE